MPSPNVKKHWKLGLLFKHCYNVSGMQAVRGIRLTPKQDLIDERTKNYGYFALLSNGIKDPLEALDIYRSKDVIEKAFDNLKGILNMRRTSVSSDENLDGKLFIQFIGLIYLSYIKKAMWDHNLYKEYYCTVDNLKQQYLLFYTNIN